MAQDGGGGGGTRQGMRGTTCEDTWSEQVEKKRIVLYSGGCTLSHEANRAREEQNETLTFVDGDGGDCGTELKGQQ